MKIVVAGALAVIALAVSGCSTSPVTTACKQVNGAFKVYDKVPAHVRDGKAQIALADAIKGIAAPLASPDNVPFSMLSDSARVFGQTLAKSDPNVLENTDVATTQLSFINDLSSVATTCKTAGVALE